MIPKTFSATAMSVGMACPRRYKAEFIDRAPQFAGDAAKLGTTLHGALEDFVRGVKINRDTHWSLDTLMALFDASFVNVFGYDHSLPEYKDGRAILTKWFARPYTFPDIVASETLTLEVKKSFPIPVIINGVKTPITFNYIIDRLDRVEPGVYRVVDYKSQRIPVIADDLYGRIQARAYAIAVAIEYPDAREIWVEFDLLRHEKVAALFTRDTNIESWRMLKKAAQVIIDTPDDDAPERLNPECMYCVRKASCATLKKNADADGIMSLTLDDMAVRYADIEAQVKALNYAKGDLEKQLLLAAASQDALEYDTQFARVRIASSMRRSVDEAKAKKIIPTQVLARYDNRVNLGIVDELLESDDLTPGQKAALREAITKKPSDPKVKVVKK